MPRTATRIAESLLPAIFQRRPKTAPYNPETGNYEFEGEPIPNTAPGPSGYLPGDLRKPKPIAFGANMLAPAESVDTQLAPAAPDTSTRPRIATQPAIQPEAPNMLAPQDPEVYGQPSRSGQSMDENAIRERRVETNSKGRPIANKVLSGDEQTLDYQNRLATMQPDKEGGGWWPKIRAALGGFAVGGPVGALSAAGTRALREHFDPELGSREYKAQEMGRNAPAVEQIRTQRKDTADIAGRQATTDLARARTKALTDPKASIKWVVKQDETGTYRPVNPATGLDPDGKPVKGKLGVANDWEIKIDKNNQYVPVNKRTGLDQNGKPVTARSPAVKDVEDVAFGNQQINQAISEAQAEQKKIDEGLASVPRTIESTDVFGAKRTIPNPDYTYNMTRRRQLDDQIRNWRIKLKSGKSKATEDDDPLGILDNDE